MHWMVLHRPVELAALIRHWSSKRGSFRHWPSRNLRGDLTAARNTTTSDSRMLKNQPKPRWPARLSLVAIGTALATIGLAAIHMGYSWFAQENNYVGTPGYAPTRSFVFWG